MKVQKVELRTDYNYDRDAASDAGALRCEDVSRTRQEMKEETDINVIVKRFGVTKTLPPSLEGLGYAQFDQAVDYRQSLDAVIAADRAFGRLSSDIRDRFNNNPHLLMQFLAKPDNFDEGVKLGLFKPKPPAEVSPQAIPESGGNGAVSPAPSAS